MPQTFTLAANTGVYHLPVDLPAAFAVVTNVRADVAISGGVYGDLNWKIYFAAWASEAAMTSGSPPGLTGSFMSTIDASSTTGSLLPLFDSALGTYLATLAGVSNVTQVTS